MTTASYKSFETDRLFIRPVAETDAPFILQILNTPKWLQFIGDRNVHTEEQAAAYIKERMLSQLERTGFGNNILINKENNTAVGVCGLYQRPGLTVTDIGFAFLPENEGKGYGYEAASRLLKAAKEDFNLEKISAITVKENYASQKLIEKLGLQFIKTLTLEEGKEELLYYEIEL